MTDDRKAIEGQCLCGAVTVKATPSAAHVEACHCSMCRRWGGGPLLSTRLITDPDISGEDHIVRYASSDWAERGFCGTCGSHIFYFFKPAGGYSFPAGLFGDLDGYALHEEIFIDEKPDYYDFAGTRERLTGAEVIAKFNAGG